MKYFTQWDSEALDADITGVDEWTGRFDAGAAYGRVITTGGLGDGPTVLPIKRRCLRTSQDGTGSGRGVLSWDRVDGDPRRADGEILALYVVSSVSRIGCIPCGARLDCCHDGVLRGLEPSADTIRIGKVVAGVNTSLATAAFSLPASSERRSHEFGLLAALPLPGHRAFAHRLGGGHVEPSTPSAHGGGRRDRGRRLLRPLEFRREHGRSSGTSSHAARDPAVVPRPIIEDEFDAWCVRQDVERCVLAEFAATGFSPASADYTKSVPYLQLEHRLRFARAGHAVESELSGDDGRRAADAGRKSGSRCAGARRRASGNFRSRTSAARWVSAASAIRGYG
jgi:hypothetical protein